MRVGPESAGADPGPICFGRGDDHGTRATVTDANLLLGRLDAESFLGGSVPLHRDRAEKLMREQKGVLASVEDFCAGILRVVETEMDKAIRVISVEQGFDPRDFTLVAFGGGGPVHACALARALRIPTVLVPAMPGALSALGILLADVVRDHARTVMLAGVRGTGRTSAERVCRGGALRIDGILTGSALRGTRVRIECFLESGCACRCNCGVSPIASAAVWVRR